MIKYLLLFVFLISNICCVFSQKKDSIDEKQTFEIISYLASDSLKGRGNYTAELNKAADFIAQKFDQDHLEYFPKANSYFLPFTSKTLTQNQKAKDSSGKYDPHYILQNVVGVLPGHTLPAEVIIFCAHYDHLGIGRMDAKDDSIFNGANDNASGTTALLMLADYFSRQNNNNRSLMFCAFSGEELGELGSGVFVNNINPKAVKAVINIEMIATTNATGKNAILVTGSSYSNFARIFKKNIGKNFIRIVPEPSETKKLFSRSDNYPFAMKGIPAHTIMCSDDDDECYHKVCDEVTRIDIKNMCRIIFAIAKGCSSIIEGLDTPSRINVSSIY